MPGRLFGAVAITATLVVALGVAAAIKRPPPDFSRLASSAIVRDKTGRALWIVRVAPAAHQIATDCRDCDSAPPGHSYQLWLASTNSPHSLGLLPANGRKVTAEMPWLFSPLAGHGELLVSREPARGSDRLAPSGPIVFRAYFPIR